jgi:hypothetical protein
LKGDGDHGLVGGQTIVSKVGELIRNEDRDQREQQECPPPRPEYPLKSRKTHI